MDITGRSLILKLAVEESYAIKEYQRNESKRLHHDINKDEAIISWCRKHRVAWRKGVIDKITNSSQDT